MDFRERLQKATERGMRAKEVEASEAAAKALSEEECRRRHSSYRLDLSEFIERCLHELADNIPGFRLETIADETGWGTVASRDDVSLTGRRSPDGRRSDSHFSRLRIVVSPYNKYHVLEIIAKGTIRNKEVFSRTHYQRLSEADLDRFRELIEMWVLDYAELFAAA